jgi:hypothetical protein
MEAVRQPLTWLIAILALSRRTKVAVTALLIAAVVATPIAPATADSFGVAPFRPVATINSPTPATYHHSGNSDAFVFLHGTANDPQDGAIAGTQMRWTVRRTNGTGRTYVLCVGSRFPGTGSTGGIKQYNDCASRTIKLPKELWGDYEVRLEAADKHGNIGEDSVSIHVAYHIA